MKFWKSFVGGSTIVGAGATIASYLKAGEVNDLKKENLELRIKAETESQLENLVKRLIDTKELPHPQPTVQDDLNELSVLIGYANNGRLSDNPAILKRFQDLKDKYPEGISVPEQYNYLDRTKPNLLNFNHTQYGLFNLDLENLSFYDCVGLAVLFNTLSVLLILSVLLFNITISNKFSEKDIKYKFLRDVFKFYLKFITIETYMLILILIIPVFCLFILGYLLLTT